MTQRGAVAAVILAGLMGGLWWWAGGLHPDSVRHASAPAGRSGQPSRASSAHGRGRAAVARSALAVTARASEGVAAGVVATAGTAAGTGGSASYFAAARMRRAQAESRVLDELEAVADDPATPPAVRAQADEAMLQLDTQQREENTAELVLQAKGFRQAVVLLSTTGAVAVVQASHFTAARAAEVAQAVAAVAAISPAQVQVVVRP